MRAGAAPARPALGPCATLKAHLLAAATAVEASRWGLPAHHPVTKKLVVLPCENHHKPTAWGVAPLLMLDVREHADDLKYPNRRGEYLINRFTIINWDNVAAATSRLPWASCHARPWGGSPAELAVGAAEQHLFLPARSGRGAAQDDDAPALALPSVSTLLHEAPH